MAEAAAASGAERLGRSVGAVFGSLRTRGSLLWYGLYTLVLFVVCFVATFPHDLLLQRVLQAATTGRAVRVETGGGSLGWTLGYAIDSLRVGGREADAEPWLHAESVRFAPSLLGLLRGSPYPLGIAAALYGGALRGSVDPRPASFRIDATLEGVDLSRYTGLRPWIEGTVRGKLEAALTLDGGGRGAAAATGPVTVRIPGFTLEGTKVRGITVPDLHFTDVHLTGTLKSGRLEIRELVADGQELGVRGEGNLLLREPVETSVVSLELVVTPAAGAPDGLKLVVGMLPGTAGEGGARRIGIVGTVARPTMR